MKRELKHESRHLISHSRWPNCRAYPDEKGIETILDRKKFHILGAGDCRAYPDEKGIETRFQDYTDLAPHDYCRAYPDEKGIETLIRRQRFQ